MQGVLPDWVRADEKRVRQIFINLLGNAIKFTNQGGVTLRVRYAREMAHVEIEDTGPGMHADELEHIFNPFERASTVAAAAHGSGLGLTIAKMLTDLMGGELTVRSEMGQGSVFKAKLFLPEVHLKAGQALHNAVQAAAKPRRGYGGARRHPADLQATPANRRW